LCYVGYEIITKTRQDTYSHGSNECHGYMIFQI
jgi:hypothetical protein